MGKPFVNHTEVLTVLINQQHTAETLGKPYLGTHSADQPATHWVNVTGPPRALLFNVKPEIAFEIITITAVLFD